MKIEFAIQGFVYLSPSEVWPDLDGPAEPTAADVAAVVAQSGDLTCWLGDWNLADEVRVTVRVGDLDVEEVEW